MFLRENSKFKLIDADFSKVVKTLDSGMYKLFEVDNGWSSSIMMEPLENKYKEGIEIKEGIFKTINKDIDSFLSEEMELAREALGMMNKCGVMFKGSPGAGKTFLAGQVAQRMCNEKNGIGIIVTDTKINMADIINIIRRDQPDIFITVVFDEFEKSFRRNDTNLLSFLDGTDSKENTLIIATINDIEALPDYVIDRPGRFEKIYDFIMSDDEILIPIIKNLMPEKYKEYISNNLELLIEDIKKDKNITIDSVRMHIRNKLYEHFKLVV